MPMLRGPHSSKVWDVLAQSGCPSVGACFPVVTGLWLSGTFSSKTSPASKDSGLYDLLVPQSGPEVQV